MVGITGALIGGALAAGGSVAAASIGKSSANKAADQAAQATTQAADQAAQVQREQLALSREIYDKNAAILDPFVKLGNIDDSMYLNALGLRGAGGARAAFDAFRNNTGYDWKLNEGLRAINGGFAGNGVFHSGSRGKRLEAYGQGLADQTYNDWLSRLSDYGNTRLGTGLAAAQATAGVGSNFAANAGQGANALSNIYSQRGADLANSALVKGQNNAAFANTAAGALGGLAGSFLYQNPYGRVTPSSAFNAAFP